MYAYWRKVMGMTMDSPEHDCPHRTHTWLALTQLHADYASARWTAASGSCGPSSSPMYRVYNLCRENFDPWPAPGHPVFESKAMLRDRVYGIRERPCSRPLRYQRRWVHP